MHRDQTIDDLELPECLRHHLRERRLERLGWFVMAAVVAVALLGGLEPGPFSRHRIETPDEVLQLEYASIVHHESPAEFVFRLRATPDSSPARLSISRSFCDHTTVESIVPRPLEEQRRGTDVV